MKKVSEMTSSNLWNSLINQQTWGGVMVNAKALGAKGDWNGSTGTDDTEAIQAAIDYAISIGKKEVTFPAGTYKYGVLTNTTGMTFIGDGVTLVGTTPLTLTNMSSIATQVNAPASATASGIVGNWAADASYLYICHSPNTWKRVAIATW